MSKESALDMSFFITYGSTKVRTRETHQDSETIKRISDPPPPLLLPAQQGLEIYLEVVVFTTLRVYRNITCQERRSFPPVTNTKKLRLLASPSLPPIPILPGHVYEIVLLQLLLSGR